MIWTCGNKNNSFRTLHLFIILMGSTQTKINMCLFLILIPPPTCNFVKESHQLTVAASIVLEPTIYIHIYNLDQLWKKKKINESE